MPWRQLAITLAACLTLNAAVAATDTARLQTLLTEQRYAPARSGLDALLREKHPDAA